MDVIKTDSGYDIVGLDQTQTNFILLMLTKHNSRYGYHLNFLIDPLVVALLKYHEPFSGFEVKINDYVSFIDGEVRILRVSIAQFKAFREILIPEITANLKVTDNEERKKRLEDIVVALDKF